MSRPAFLATLSALVIPAGPPAAAEDASWLASAESAPLNPFFFQQNGGDMFRIQLTWTADGALYPVDNAVIQSGKICGTFAWGCTPLDGLPIWFGTADAGSPSWRTYWFSVRVNGPPCSVLWGQMAFAGTSGGASGIAEIHLAFGCRSLGYEGLGGGFATRCPLGVPTHAGCPL